MGSEKAEDEEAAHQKKMPPLHAQVELNAVIS